MGLALPEGVGCEPRNHQVGFCADPALLTRNVGSFLLEGLRLDEALLVVATPERRTALTDALRKEQVDVDRHVADNRLTMLDARETLAGFMTDAGIDAPAFEATVGQRVRRLRSNGAALRVYGEMVDLLWQEGRTEEALRVEELWNRLLQRFTFTLYCNYRIDPLDPTVRLADFERVLALHSEVRAQRPSPAMEKAVDRALKEVLGADTVESLKPLIRGTQYPRAVVAGPEAALLWVRRHLPAHAGEVLARAQAHFASEKDPAVDGR